MPRLEPAEETRTPVCQVAVPIPKVVLGLLENVVNAHPGLYSELREIECLQCRLIDQFDLTIHHVQNYDPQRDDILDMVSQFQRLHQEILEEESQERILVDRGLA